MPGPPNAGSRAGWILISRWRNRATAAGGIRCRYPASTARSASRRAVSSSAASRASERTVVGTPASRARSSAPASGRLEMTRTTRAGPAGPSASSSAWRFVPLPETSTATRTGLSLCRGPGHGPARRVGAVARAEVIRRGEHALDGLSHRDRVRRLAVGRRRRARGLGGPGGPGGPALVRHLVLVSLGEREREAARLARRVARRVVRAGVRARLGEGERHARVAPRASVVVHHGGVQPAQDQHGIELVRGEVDRDLLSGPGRELPELVVGGVGIERIARGDLSRKRFADADLACPGGGDGPRLRLLPQDAEPAGPLRLDRLGAVRDAQREATRLQLSRAGSHRTP